MAWLESHGNLARHPKTRRLMQRMGWTLPFTIGNLHLLWYWALEYAPTGDLTKFTPEDLTYDLDLGDSTPEQFLEAMVEAGFLDRTGSGFAESRLGGTGFIDSGGSGTLRLHDWPDYTAKSLRPKFRRYPERWHQVLRSYGRPVITRASRRRDIGVATPLVQPVSSRALRDDQMVGNALRAVRREYPSAVAERESEVDAHRADPNTGPTDISSTIEEHGPQGAVRIDCIKDAARQGEEHEPWSAVRVDCTDRCSSPSRHGGDGSEVSGDERNQSGSDRSQTSTTGGSIPQNSSSANTELAPIPKCLSGRRNFNDWWIKLQELYQNKNSPLTPYEQSEILAMLARHPFTAVEKLQYSVVNFEKSYATLLAPKKREPANSS